MSLHFNHRSTFDPINQTKTILDIYYIPNSWRNMAKK